MVSPKSYAQYLFYFERDMRVWSYGLKCEGKKHRSKGGRGRIGDLLKGNYWKGVQGLRNVGGDE